MLNAHSAEKCGVPDAFRYRSILTGERQSLPFHYDSEHFRIWFDTIGINKIKLYDISPRDGVSDWVQKTAFYLEKVRSFLVDTIDMRDPVPDSSSFSGMRNVGGDDRTDVYFIDMLTHFGTAYYGMTYPDSMLSGGELSAYIFIENDFDALSFPNYVGREELALAATCAHEFSHVLHYAYGINYNWLWWLEATAVWAEERVFPHVDDYIAYLPIFQQSPEKGLFKDTPSGRIYGTCLFPLFISLNWGDSSISNIWKRVPTYHVYRAIQNWADSSVFVSLDSLYGEFAKWNLFVGDNHRGFGYPDAYLMPEPKIIPPDSCPDSLSGGGSAVYIDLSSNSIGGVWASIVPINRISARMHGISSVGTDAPDTSVNILGEGDTIPGAWRFDKIIAIPAHLSRTPTSRANFNRIIYGPAPSARVSIPIADADFSPFPNPFIYGINTAIYFPYTLGEDSKIRLSVWNTNGELIFEFDSETNRGYHLTPKGSLEWIPRNQSGKPLASGVYNYILRLDETERIGKIAIIKP